MKKLAHFLALASALACSSATRVGSVGAACPNSDAGITLPRGFCATVFADSLGSARQLVVAPNGDVFVNLQRQQRGPVSSIPAGLVALRDTNKDGRADTVERFGTGGNTGITVQWISVCRRRHDHRSISAR